MKKFIPFLFLMVSGCTVEVPDYVSAETGESSHWIDSWGDTEKDFSIWVTYSSDKVLASVTMYQDPTKMDSILDLDVFITEFSDQDAGLSFTYGQFPGSLKIYRYGHTYAEIRDSVIQDCDSLPFNQIDFNCQKVYSVSQDSLPETLEVWYNVKTTQGIANGKVQFRKIIREEEQTLRIH